jgi:hypothetical protein
MESVNGTISTTGSDLRLTTIVEEKKGNVGFLGITSRETPRHKG